MDTQYLIKWIQDLIAQDSLWKFYKSKEFMKVKTNVLKRQHYECQVCRDRGIITRATTVHHVQFVRTHPELALSEYYIDENGEKHRNLLAVCKSCHNKIHAEKGNYKPRTIKVVTGLPGAGKTTYVAARREPDEPVYDLDYFVQAMALNGEAQKLTTIANHMLKEFVLQCQNKSAWVIRVAPHSDELKFLLSHGCVFIDIDTPRTVCQERRKIPDDEMNLIVQKHQLYMDELCALNKMMAGAAEEKERW